MTATATTADATVDPVANPYLEGNFAPVHTEVTATDLTVTGSIPPELDGRYLRNGPNPAAAPEPSTYHWFLGDGMVHGLRLRDGRAEWYRNRWVRSGPVAAALGESPPAGLGQVHGGMDFAANTNVIGHAGRTFAIVEAGALPYELTEELDTIGPCDFGGTLSGGYTAHPKRDPLTGDLYAVSYYFGWGNDVEVSVIGADARVRSARRVTMGGPVSVHDCAITQRYIVLFDLPVLFSMEMVTSGASFPYRWDDDYPARVGLLPRDGDETEPVWHDVEPCYVFHPMNAYDEPDGDGIVLDVARHPAMFRTSLLGPNEGPPTLERWHLDGHGGPVKEERLDDQGQEFPRVDERRVGLPHRYGYSVTFGPTGGVLGSDSGLLRHDVVAGTSQRRSFGPGATLGEAVFVPRHESAAEADGWVITLVHQRETDSSSLYILNAEDLCGEPQAIVQLPQRVPDGFHGNWVPS
ncbi:MAG TPA: carotenoid oxygenase family protein [Acidimicrobiales bacterium]|jgi:carotenoid cleavage dioxygenase|nr:carotenoid oxygenase family protein [Acidimicrobiales bacterium]